MLAIVLFAIGVLLLFWTLVGFPLALAHRAGRLRAAGPPEARFIADAELPAVTVVIAVHNGEAFLADKVASIRSSDYPTDRLRIIVASDGSSDRTNQIGESLSDGETVRFVPLPRGGKASTLSAVFPLVDGEIAVLTDVRQSLEPQCIRQLVQRFRDPAVGVVSGTLRIRSGATAGETGTGLYWRYEVWIRNNLSQVDSVLGATGGIYAMRRSLLRPIPAGCLLDDVWLPMQAVLEGSRSLIEPSAVAWDFPTSLASEFGRKVRTQAGIYQVLQLDPRLLSPRRNRVFWSFVNLKLLRLMLPHMLLLVFVASWFLPSALRSVALAGQAVFYGAALMHRVFPERSAAQRLTAPFAAFVTLVWAAFCAQRIFFTDPATLWTSTTVGSVKETEGSA